MPKFVVDKQLVCVTLKDKKRGRAILFDLTTPKEPHDFLKV